MTYLCRNNINLIKKLMKKQLRFAFLTMLLLLCGSIQAGTIVFGDLNLENGVQYPDPFDGGDFTVTFAGGANDGKYYNTGTGIRVYGNGTMTIAAKQGTLTKIVLTLDAPADKVNQPTASDVNVGTYDPETFTWTGNEGTVVFQRPTGSGHWRVQKVEATVSGGGQAETKAAKPAIRPNGGNFYDQQEVTITAAEGATIYYALNKGDYSLYKGPFTLTETAVVSAYAIDESCDVKQSDVTEVTFTKVTIQKLTVAQAMEIIGKLEDGASTDDMYDVSGYVVSTPDFQRNSEGALYGNVNFDMADTKGDAVKLTVFRAKNFGNEAFTEETINKFKEGEAIVVRGKLQRYKDKDGSIKPELSYGYLIATGQNAGIGSITTSATANGIIYNLAGQQVKQPKKGLYIVNGKKTIF